MQNKRIVVVAIVAQTKHKRGQDEASENVKDLYNRNEIQLKEKIADPELERN